ncbi:YslB family protein [Planococcus sp. CAU13]|uniref:YslB family protein n=1 Tax=Planococcus sp. CAU13 TaxID=1541197 RepID=UPI00052FE429|nr:YslB family protein [Planococcus sp. CAU13]
MTAKEPEITDHFGYEIIRDYVLSDVLGQHESDVLYWAGKSLARKFPLFSLDEAADFFVEAGFGELALEKAGKDETVFVLRPLKVESRCFKLEAGFLAQQKQKIGGFLTEAYEEVSPKKKIVRITLKTDLREQV